MSKLMNLLNNYFFLFGLYVSGFYFTFLYESYFIQLFMIAEKSTSLKEFVSKGSLVFLKFLQSSIVIFSGLRYFSFGWNPIFVIFTSNLLLSFIVWDLGFFNSFFSSIEKSFPVWGSHVLPSSGLISAVDISLWQDCISREIYPGINDRMLQDSMMKCYDLSKLKESVVVLDDVDFLLMASSWLNQMYGDKNGEYVRGYTRKSWYLKNFEWGSHVPYLLYVNTEFWRFPNSCSDPDTLRFVAGELRDILSPQLLLGFAGEMTGSGKIDTFYDFDYNRVRVQVYAEFDPDCAESLVLNVPDVKISKIWNCTYFDLSDRSYDLLDFEYDSYFRVTSSEFDVREFMKSEECRKLKPMLRGFLITLELMNDYKKELKNPVFKNSC